MTGDCVQGELFAGEQGNGGTRDGQRGLRVTVRWDASGRGYALFDGAGRRLFGTLRFSTEAAAEAYLAEANREARWVKWHLVRPGRPRVRLAPQGNQLGLFGDK